MNPISYFAVRRDILKDPLFLKNPSMGWFFLYCHSEAMFRDYPSPCLQIDRVIDLKRGQFWKSVRAFAKECPVASKSTLFRWAHKLEETGHLKLEIVGKEKLGKKWDTLDEKVGHPSLKYGTGICVVTVQKYLVISDELQKDGTPLSGTVGTKKWDRGVFKSGTRRIRSKKTKNLGGQMTFLDGGNGEGQVIDLGRPDLSLVGTKASITDLPENIQREIQNITKTGSPFEAISGTVVKG